MAQDQKTTESAREITRLATQLAKDPSSKAFLPLAEEYGKVGMWQDAASILEDGLKLYPGFITAMVSLGRAYDEMGQTEKAKTILEESVKLSPENLRAHRTLIKIYRSKGLNELALQSCAVILTVNPHDEAALSVQLALGGPLKHKKTLEQSQPTAPVKIAFSITRAAAAEPPVSAPDKPEIAAANPLAMPTKLMETALHNHDQTATEPASPKPDADPQASDTVEASPPALHAGVVVQLEAWLRTIESRRRDRGATNKSHSKTSL
ncbi:MAG: hypothetical protein RL042_1946 [Nitrospirota bacterium]|jgi:tetratricopeptide (TPR) repeat protein